MIRDSIGSPANNCMFEFCNSCCFYPCELIPGYKQYVEYHSKNINIQAFVTSSNNPEKKQKATLLNGINIPNNPKEVSYDKDDLTNHCIMRYPNNEGICQIECDEKYVADGIEDHYKIELTYDSKIIENTNDRWEPSQPVFISAQTGQGKNYFIEHKLINYVKKLNYIRGTNQKVLILSNRRILKQQIKNRLNQTNIESEENSDIHYGLYADVMTYQSLLYQKESLESRQKSGKSKYLFVVCDEAHFFTSDAMFNPHTQKILEKIVTIFKDAIRIYMSATPYECLEYILLQERAQSNYYPMVMYHFKRNYNYLKVKAYSEFDELYEIIAQSVSNARQKWLIFVDNINKCENLKKDLEEYSPLLKGKVETINATSKDDKNNAVYTSIVLKEKLPADTYVLISTSVLDNGINLWRIDNVVVSDISKTKILQMLGRARVHNGSIQKTLYIKRFNTNSVQSLIKALDKRMTAYHKYNMAYGLVEDPFQPIGRSKYDFFEKYFYGNEIDWNNAKHWFGISLEAPKLSLNEIAKSMTEKLYRQYNYIAEEMDSDDPIGQGYLEQQFSWFGKEYHQKHDITYRTKENAAKEFIKFLEIHEKNETVNCNTKLNTDKN